MRLKGKTALVTGAASGIGRACAERLAAEGASVVLSDVQEVKGEAVAEAIRATGTQAIFVKHDVTKEVEWVTTIEAAQSRFKALHILVNNAGIGRPSPITETSMENWRLQFSINLDGMFLGMKHAIPLIAQSGGGSIVNISSTAGMKAYPNMSGYCASKAGVRHMSKVAALECAQNKTGIRVNSVHPGTIDTPMVSGPEFEGVDKAAYFAKQPIPRIGTSEEVASLVLYLISDESGFATGGEFVIDGGVTAGEIHEGM